MKKYLCLVCIALYAQLCMAQIRVSSTKVDDWVKKNFSGQGVVIGNIKFHGATLSMAAFTSTPNVLQVQRGLVLSTGSAFMVAGFNNRYNASTAFRNMGENETDPDLSKIIKGQLYDICYIEFDFVPMGNSVQFNYQFGSDEYPEYVGSAYNDIFAFFISDDKSTRNIAVIPGKDVPVSVNTINAKADSAYFLDNNPFAQPVAKRPGEARKDDVKRTIPGKVLHGVASIFSPRQVEDEAAGVIQDPALIKKLNPAMYRNLQFDGITRKMAAQAFVEPYKKYHLKIIIADVADNIYDSGVFIEDRSLTAKRDSLAPGFVDYPDMSKIIDPKLILAGKKVEDILPDTLSINNIAVYFDTDKSEVLPSELAKLKKMVGVYDMIKSNYEMFLVGHTDSVGSLSYNIELSKRRNQAVTDSLNKYIPGIRPNSISEKAFLQPAATNSTEEGRHRNRRVEIIFIKRRK
ncbi:OmpA family protein [Hufsiella ginkgonis]|uniref:OmpA family protein n=1 Tax=Hufsiella ginkgonis TaxID=2695274 RepID=A0A7K1Y2N8_9SPHI|nr:OmpA family protein [Hufsiella ginkgonis]MXV17535.1 OmpA family protein [Hufsiella ginkgonis]